MSSAIEASAAALPHHHQAASSKSSRRLKDVLLPWALEFAVSGAGVATASSLTNPIDVIKVRMQLVPDTPGTRRPGLLATGAGIVRSEGVPALWSGMSAAVARSIVYGGLRLGMYNPVKDALAAALAGSDGESSSSNGFRPRRSGGGGGGGSFGLKLVAGSLSGGVAAALSSPLELVKVRLQRQGATERSAAQVVRAVVAADGVRGLWKGATPGLARAAALTASQCATYDEVKRRVIAATGAADGLPVHLGTAMVTGLVSTTTTNPFDLVKNHMFVASRSDGPASPLAVAADVYRRHGAAGFMRGWTANYARLGPQTVCIFVVVEHLRSLLGLHSL